MKAAFYQQRGVARDVLQVGEQIMPKPGPGQVRVKVAISAVNPSDTKARDTWFGTQMAYPLVIPHQDGAGVVDLVGEGVSETRVGERVWLYMSQYGQACGTAAEYVVVPAHRAVQLPVNTSFEQGAMLGIPAMTAHYALFGDGPIAGQTVLVQGGAGAVGFYAVQLAKWGGAQHVIATVSRNEQAEQARLAGADLVVNYKTQGVVQAVRDYTGKAAPVNRVIEVAFGANQATDLALLAQNGVIASYGSDAVPKPELLFYELARKDARLHIVLIYEARQSARDAAARDINHLLETGFLKHQIASRFDLDDIAAAHEAMESGRSVGKILVDIS
jgi:NADPH:quinone reductase